jgi:hypothetical protein
MLSGLGLLLAPRATLALMQSNVEYDPTMARWVAMLSMALATLIIQSIRHRLSVLYPFGFMMPAAMLIGFLGFYVQTRNPLFLSIAFVVGLGVAATGVSWLIDKASKVSTS